MADIRPLLLSGLRAIDKLHVSGKVLDTSELNLAAIPFNSSGEIEFIRAFTQQSRHKIVSPFEAPEVLVDPAQVTAKSDVWSFGCWFVLLLRGAPLFCGASGSVLLAKICASNLESSGMKQILPSRVSKTAIELICACLQRSPDKRPKLRSLLKHKIFAGEGVIVDVMFPSVAALLSSRVRMALYTPRSSSSLSNFNKKDSKCMPKHYLDSSSSEKQLDDSSVGEGTVKANPASERNLYFNRKHPSSIFRLPPKLSEFSCDNFLHMTVESCRLTAASVSWAASKTQASCSNVYTMLSINIWKNAEDANDVSGKKFYAQKWCSGASMQVRGSGMFSATVAQHYRYEISSDQLFGTEERPSTLMLIVLVRVESVIIGSAIVPLETLGKMGSIDGWYHITSGGKVMGQVKVSASPTLPTAVDHMHLFRSECVVPESSTPPPLLIPGSGIGTEDFNNVTPANVPGSFEVQLRGSGQTFNVNPTCSDNASSPVLMGALSLTTNNATPRLEITPSDKIFARELPSRRNGDFSHILAAVDSLAGFSKISRGKSLHALVTRKSPPRRRRETPKGFLSSSKRFPEDERNAPLPLLESLGTENHPSLAPKFNVTNEGLKNSKAWWDDQHIAIRFNKSPSAGVTLLAARESEGKDTTHSRSMWWG